MGSRTNLHRILAWMVEKGGDKLSYDNACKYLAESSPLAFARWLLNVESENIKVLKTELSIEPQEKDMLLQGAIYRQKEVLA